MDRDENFVYCAQPGRRGICRVSLATGRAQLLRPRTRKEREMPISDREWAAAVPAVTRMVRAAAAEPEGVDFAPVPPSPWDQPTRGIGPLTAAERRGRSPLLDPEGPDFAQHPGSIWDRRR